MDRPIRYFDNAATSWPKPPEVRRAMDQYLDEIGGNPGRAGHRLSVAAARVVAGAREALARFLPASMIDRALLETDSELRLAAERRPTVRRCRRAARGQSR